MPFLLSVLKQHSRQVALFRCACTNCNAATCVFYTRLLSMIIRLLLMIMLFCFFSPVDLKLICFSHSLSLSFSRSRLLYLYLPSRSLFWTLREFHSTNYVTCIIWNIFNLISFNEANPMKTTYIFIKIRDFLRRTSIICWWVSDWMLLLACHQCMFWNRVNHKYATNTPHPFK